jgi:hypothetical protein
VRAAGFALCLLLACRAAGGASLEVSVQAGATLPFYRQSFRYDPGRLISPLPGLTLVEQGSFGLDARGAVAAGGSLALQLTDVFGIEARLDTADVKVDALPARYEARAVLPPPLPEVSTQLDLGVGTVEVDRLMPVSLNLKMRSPGRVRLALSAGVSYLPTLNVAAFETIGLGATGLGDRLTRLEIATLRFRARASPSEEQGRFGANAGLAVQLPLSRRVWAFGEGRGFLFGRHDVRWQRADSGPLSSLEAALAAQVESRLPPVQFNPAFFQLALGLSLSF